MPSIVKFTPKMWNNPELIAHLDLSMKMKVIKGGGNISLEGGGDFWLSELCFSMNFPNFSVCGCKWGLIKHISFSAPSVNSMTIIM